MHAPYLSGVHVSALTWCALLSHHETRMFIRVSPVQKGALVKTCSVVQQSVIRVLNLMPVDWGSWFLLLTTG